MKKLVVLIIPILLLTACTSNEEDKIAYLEYKNELEKQETFSPEDELDFNVYFNISKEGEEITNYSILINNPKVNMHKVKALLIHNYIIDEAYPSIGIMDKPVELLKDNNNKIELKGKIQTSENISNVKYKLYIEYTTDDGKENLHNAISGHVRGCHLSHGQAKDPYYRHGWNHRRCQRVCHQLCL